MSLLFITSLSLFYFLGSMAANSCFASVARGLDKISVTDLPGNRRTTFDVSPSAVGCSNRAIMISKRALRWFYNATELWFNNITKHWFYKIILVL